MIIPSIDLQAGRSVQLRQGAELAIDAGDPAPLLERFALAGEVALIDLDAALSQGNNGACMGALLERFPCRVGGGIRTAGEALSWLDRGASQVILGTAAQPEILAQLPPKRVIAALDARHGEVVDQGWRRSTGVRVEERMRELRPHVEAFMVTFVEKEGMLQGLPIDRVPALLKAARGARLTVAGGVASCREIAELDALGVDVQVGMALYAGQLSLADGIVAPLQAKLGAQLWPTLVCDPKGVALGLVYSTPESVRRSVELRRGVYFSRSRNQLWEKGKTSGNHQELLRIELDCDRDTLRFTVQQHGSGFCHRGSSTCFGAQSGMAKLEATLWERRQEAPAASYSSRLFREKGLLQSKLCEEARELGEAQDAQHVAEEAADLLFFLQAKLAREGVPLSQVEAVLDRRALKVSRRPGNAKPLKR